MKRVTIKDVAADAGVSISVVSYILNNTPGQTFSQETRDRVLKSAKNLDYIPNAIAQGMRKTKSQTIGLVSFWGITDPAFVYIMEGISKVLAQNNQSLLFLKSDLNGQNESYINAFKKRLIDGVILILPHETKKDFNELHIDLLIKNKIPSVIINGDIISDKIQSIQLDYYGSTYACVKYLKELGHTAIGCITPDDKISDYKSSSQRMDGFHKGLIDNKLQLNKDFVFSINEMKDLLEMIKRGCAPTAIVAFKAEIAKEFAHLIYESGYKIPDSISLIAANSEAGAEYLYPPLTTIEIPLEAIGVKAAEVILDIKNAANFEPIVITNKLCERKSVKKIIK